jgi:hypothetical protein
VTRLDEPAWPGPAADATRHDLAEQAFDAVEAVAREYVNRGGRKRQPWPVVPAAWLMRVHGEFAAQGTVLSERLLDRIAERMVANLLRLNANTELMGHTARTLADALEGTSLAEADLEGFEDWAVDDRGMWRLTDVGLPGLFRYAAMLLEERPADERLAVVNLMLQIAHQRSDLAASFVEGGSRTLDSISLEGGPPADAPGHAPGP